MSKIEDGELICKAWKDSLVKFIEPKMFMFYTDSIKNRNFGKYPIPFCKKFDMNGQQDLKLHNDNSVLTLYVKLNDDFTGCETVFPRQNWDTSNMYVGDLAVWPGVTTHPHYTKKLLSGSKYSLVGRHSILTQRGGKFDDIDFLNEY